MSFRFEAIGTEWVIDTPTPLSESEKKQILAIIDAFDQVYSRFRADSVVTKLGTDGGSASFPSDFSALIDAYRLAYVATDGLVTPLIGDLMAEVGYNADYTFQKGVPVVPPKWEDVIHIDGGVVTLSQPALLDFGAGGKGYLVDLVGNELRFLGISSFTVDASGDLLVVGRPERIGLENSLDHTEVIGVAEISQGALCASSGSRRAWGEYTHILDPKKLASPRGIEATWVYAETALVADILATCLFFVGPEKLRTFGPFEYVLQKPDGVIEYSESFPGHIFTEY